MFDDLSWLAPSKSDYTLGGENDYSKPQGHSGYIVQDWLDKSPVELPNLPSVEASNASGGGWFSNAMDFAGDAFKGVWNWANTDMGLAVIGGALGEIFGNDDKKKKSSSGYDGYGGYGGGGGGGPSAAELQEKRYQEHNNSINQKMDMGLIKFKKK